MHRSLDWFDYNDSEEAPESLSKECQKKYSESDFKKNQNFGWRAFRGHQGQREHASQKPCIRAVASCCKRIIS